MLPPGSSHTQGLVHALLPTQVNSEGPSWLLWGLQGWLRPAVAASCSASPTSESCSLLFLSCWSPGLFLMNILYPNQPLRDSLPANPACSPVGPYSAVLWHDQGKWHTVLLSFDGQQQRASANWPKQHWGGVTWASGKPGYKNVIRTWSQSPAQLCPFSLAFFPVWVLHMVVP
jgi:hypothetical protein